LQASSSIDWAIAEGIADPKRVAICGASYGGYAAFVGATFTPDTFCCSVPVVGITDLETMMANPPPYWASYYEQECLRVGDPRTEEGLALLRARSPLHRVDRISKPMLIGHGANDVRCKIAEAEQIVSAMIERSIPVTYVVFPDEGHGFAHPANNIAFNAIAEAFLAVHLGGRCETIGQDFENSSHEVRLGGRISGQCGRAESGGIARSVMPQSSAASNPRCASMSSTVFDGGAQHEARSNRDPPDRRKRH
jgi:acylaminoacyl-peptidase